MKHSFLILFFSFMTLFMEAQIPRPVYLKTPTVVSFSGYAQFYKGVHKNTKPYATNLAENKSRGVFFGSLDILAPIDSIIGMTSDDWRIRAGVGISGAFQRHGGNFYAVVGYRNFDFGCTVGFNTSRDFDAPGVSKGDIGGRGKGSTSTGLLLSWHNDFWTIAGAARHDDFYKLTLWDYSIRRSLQPELGLMFSDVDIVLKQGFQFLGPYVGIEIILFKKVMLEARYSWGNSKTDRILDAPDQINKGFGFGFSRDFAF